MLPENDFFYCEGLLENSENIQLIQSCHVARETGIGLEVYLKNFAISDELNHQARTYLVKDKKTAELVGYFSLKAGQIANMASKSLFQVELDTIPAIELANFAVNDNYKLAHKESHGVGAAIFYYFILPICHDASDYVGIDAIYIYALPYTPLLQYYGALHFRRLPKSAERFVHRYCKPRYDQGCIFMIRPLHSET